MYCIKHVLVAIIDFYNIQNMIMEPTRIDLFAKNEGSSNI